MASATVGSLAALQGNDAGGLSATNISRLTNEWETEYRAFQKRSLADRDYVYVWVDGVHFNVRLQDDRLCTLVMIGVRPDGTKELITVEDGYRENAESWKTVLRDLKRRGRGQCIRPLWRARAPRVFMARVSNSPPAHPARSKSSSWGGRSYERRSSSVDSQRARKHERHADHWHARSLPSAVGVRHRSEPLVSIWYHERYLCALRPHLRVLDDVAGGTDQQRTRAVVDEGYECDVVHEV